MFCGRHLQEGFIVIGSIGVTVRQDVAMKTSPRNESSSRDFISFRGCG